MEYIRKNEYIEQEDKGMRNKVVKQMLMFGMASMLAVNSPVVGWASENETETETDNQERGAVEVTSHLYETELYKDKKVNSVC